MELFLLSILNGISFGFILFLVAAGLSLIMGVMGILNLAHGALYMAGAYVGWWLASKHGLSFWVALIVGASTGGLIGVAMERGFLRYLYKRPLEQVVVTWGFVLIAVNMTMWIWGPAPKAPYTAPFLTGSFRVIGSWNYPVFRIAIIVIGIGLAIGLWVLQNRTRIGAMVRGGMDDKEITMGLGVNVGRVSSFVFILGSFIAGFAGVMGAGLLGPYLGGAMDILLLALAVVIVGGMGSVQGALLGSMLIGLIDAFGKALFPELAMATMYLAMIGILLVKPHGLLGRKI